MKFFSDQTWANILSHGKFDYIVVGSGCTALAFIDKALELNKNARILCLERGGTFVKLYFEVSRLITSFHFPPFFWHSHNCMAVSRVNLLIDFWLPSHFQNLPLPFKMVLGGPSETFPWTLSRKTFETKELQFCHGSCPFFGGRSTFWSAWSPQPSEELMRNFPDSMKATAQKESFWKEAKKLLNVTPASRIDDTVFGELQTAIDEILVGAVGGIASADYVESAPLAVGRRSPTSTLRFNKFSVPGPLLNLYENQRHLAKTEEGAPLELMVNCSANRMIQGDDGVVRVIETSKGTLSWTGDNTKIILCAGAVPNVTLLLNSLRSATRLSANELRVTS